MSLRACLNALALLLGLWGFLASTALAQDTRLGNVYVRIDNQTPDSTARVGDIDVRVFAFDGNQRLAERQLLTAEDGTALAEGMEVTDERRFIVSVLYQGVVYVTHGASFEAGADRLDIEVPVFESTGDDANLIIEQLHVVVTPEQEGGYLVSEIVAFNNQGQTTIVGGKDSSITVRMDIPEGVRDFSVLEGFLDRHISVGEGAYVITGALHPGRTQGVFSYKVPTSDAWFWRRRFATPVEQVSVFAPETGPAILSRSLIKAESMEIDGRLFNRYTADAASINQGLRFEVSGEVSPAAATSEHSAAASPAGMLLGGLLTLATLVLLIRPLMVPAPPGLVGEGRWVTPAQARRIELERRKEVRLEAVREIDFDFETGKLAPEDYGPLREQYKNEAMALMGELDKLGAADGPPTTPADGEAAPPARGEAADPGAHADPAPAAASAEPISSAARQCPACDHANPPDARFCSSCGAALACPACGGENPPGARFCNHCGDALPAPERASG